MNVQTERIDNHKAQFTVEIEAQQLDDAKRKAAKKIAKSIRIKGFRKGKAPYRIISQYVGEAAILEEAIELLGNDIYRDALEASEVEPYGPGTLDDFKVDPAPTFIFSVPLQPEVNLQSYTDIRLDFEVPEVTDEDVENALKQMQRQQAEVVDDAVEEVAEGHRVTIDLHSEFADGEDADEDEDDDTEETEDGDEAEDTEAETEASDEDEDTITQPKKGDHFIHRHDATLVLDTGEEPILPGFVAAMVGAKLDEDVEFELTIPEDHEDYKDIAGRKVQFHVTIKKIEEINMPALDDELAKKLTELDGDEPLDLEGLRKRTREELEEEALENAKSRYGDQVLGEIIQGAEIAYPELMLEEQIDDMLKDLDNNLRQQGLNLDTYMRITGTSKESLQEQYRDNAIDSLKRTLVLRELIDAQEIEVGDEQIDTRIDNMMIQFGAQGAQFRSMIDTPQMRQNILNELLIDNIMTRLVAIGQGEDPMKALEERQAKIDADNEKVRERVNRMMAQQEAQEAEAEEAEVVEADVETEATETSDEVVAEAEETVEAESAETDADEDAEAETDE